MSVNPSLRLVLLWLRKQIRVIVVDEGAHPDSSSSRHDVIESAALVYQVFITSNTWKTARNSKTNAETLIYDAMKVWIFLQLDPAELVRVFVLELFSQAGKFFGL